MRKRILTGLAVVASLVVGAAGIATASNNSSHDEGRGEPAVEPIHPPQANGSRLDDGKQLLPKAKITERQATRAAKKAAQGPLNETDLEYYNGRLVWNVDVGQSDVKVDATNGAVLGKVTD